MDGKGGREWRKTDTMPQPGKVGQVCQQWLVHEDEALAFRLQNEEISTHYHHNRSRNAQIRQDLPQAKEEQAKEAEEAERLRAMYRMMLRRQEERDAELAAKLQHQVAVGRTAAPPREEDSPSPPPPPRPPHSSRPPRPLGSPDSRLYSDPDRADEDDASESALGAVGGAGAFYYPPPSPIKESDFPFLDDAGRDEQRPPPLQLVREHPLGTFFEQRQELPLRRYPPPPHAVAQSFADSKRKPIVMSSDEDLRDLGARGVDDGHDDDGEEVAVEGRREALAEIGLRNGSVEPNANYVEDDDDDDDDDRYMSGQPRFDFLSEEEEEEARRRQELEDEEFAKRLQEEEVRDMSPLEILNRDRIIAMEAQDREYARLLYEKEKARARRAARERRARKEAQEQPPQQQQPQRTRDAGKEETPRRASSAAAGGGTANEAFVESDLDSHDRRERRGGVADPDEIEVVVDDDDGENEEVGRRPPRARSLHERAVDVGSLDKRDVNANKARRHKSYGAPEDEEFIGTSPICPQPFVGSTSPAPPYMPIQGHRRMQAFEKKSKKKDKGCSQQ